MKVSELEGRALDDGTSKAQGFQQVSTYRVLDADGITIIDGTPYTPSINGQQAMDLVEKYEIILRIDDNKVWWAERRLTKEGQNAYQTSFDHAIIQKGPTPKIAACRVVIASVYGEEVQDV